MISREFKNRIGYDGFNWWIGVAEDSKDPLGLGRCRVRIFGSHTDDLNLIPTEDLPWAMTTNSPNNSKTVSRIIEGSYVLGFYTDGDACQSPVIIGVFSSIPQTEPQPNIGFTGISKAYNNEEAAKEIVQQPQVPSVAPDNKIVRKGEPTTPKNALSANNTILSWTNSQTVHACDFRFLINFGDLNIGTIEDPIALIKQAIANAQNKAAAIVQAILAQLVDEFRITMKGIQVSLNLDPTGELSKAFSFAKDAIREINQLSKKVAQYVGNAALVVALLNQIQTVIDWIKSLPANILAMLKECLSTFQNAVSTATKQVQLIPGQVSSSVLGAFQSLETQTTSTISNAYATANTANVPNTLITLVTSPDTANVQDLSIYITSTYANSNVIIDETQSASFNVANTSTP